MCVNDSPPERVNPVKRRSASQNLTTVAADAPRDPASTRRNRRLNPREQIFTHNSPAAVPGARFLKRELELEVGIDVFAGKLRDNYCTPPGVHPEHRRRH